MCYTIELMASSVRKLAAFRLEPDILDGLQFVKERDGVPVSEQVRRALIAWLETRGVKMERQRVSTRPRSSIKRQR